MSITCWDFSIK